VSEKRKINLLQLVYGFGVGGGEAKLLELVDKLDKEKYAITVCSVGLGGPLEQQFRDTGADVLVVKKRWRFDPTLIFKVAKLVKQRKIDVVMTTLFYADIVGAAASFLVKPKALISWEVITHPLNARRRLMYKLLSSRFDVVVTVSNSIWDFVIKKRSQNKNKIKTIYYGVDLDAYAPAKKSGDLAKELGNPDCIFGVVARLRYQKGHVHLIDAVPKVIEKYPNVKFVFIGSGDQEELLRQRVADRNVQNQVIFLGLRRDIKYLLNEIDVFVLPSLWEGFPNVVLEAMGCAKPVIATSVEGTIELVADGESGILMPPANPEALADALITMLDSPKLIKQYGNAGRKRVETYFSVGKQVREFEALYDEIVQTPFKSTGKEYTGVTMVIPQTSESYL